MDKRTIVIGVLLGLVLLLLVPQSPVRADSTTSWEDVCWAIDPGPNVDAFDVSRFLSHFGRSIFSNPCPQVGWSIPQATGQTVSVTPFDDAWYHAGIVDPDVGDWDYPRFENNGDGTVTDQLTGLVWLEWSSCGPQMNWDDALAYVNTLGSGTDCGNPGT